MLPKNIDEQAGPLASQPGFWFLTPCFMLNPGHLASLYAGWPCLAQSSYWNVKVAKRQSQFNCHFLFHPGKLITSNYHRVYICLHAFAFKKDHNATCHWDIVLSMPPILLGLLLPTCCRSNEPSRMLHLQCGRRTLWRIVICSGGAAQKARLGGALIIDWLSGWTLVL